MSALWTTATMARAMNAEIKGIEPDCAIDGLSIDSRTVAPGDAFLAIKGDAFDGHDFVERAYAGGAALSVVARERADTLGPEFGPLLIVDDVMDAMRALARTARARSSGKIIAVTGSVGKTGTKEALRLALSEIGETHASVKSFNNHWGVPLTLGRMPESADFGIFEIGMNHAGEILPLSQMVRPHVAIVTTVEPVHIEFFNSIDEIAEAKAEIFIGLASNGTAVIPADNPHAELLTDRARTAGALRVLTFGMNAGADVRLLDHVPDAEGATISADLLGRRVDYRLNVPGRHWVSNSLAVLAALLAVDVDLHQAMAALEDLRAPQGRGQTVRLPVGDGFVALIDESYNANPASMRAAIAVLGAAETGQAGRHIAVLGDMRELGDQSQHFHAGLIEPLAANDIDLTFAAGPWMENLFDLLPHDRRGTYAIDSKYLIEPLIDCLRPGDVVMIKGSLGSRMGPIVEALKNRFSSENAA